MFVCINSPAVAHTHWKPSWKKNWFNDLSQYLVDRSYNDLHYFTPINVLPCHPWAYMTNGGDLTQLNTIYPMVGQTKRFEYPCKPQAHNWDRMGIWHRKLNIFYAIFFAVVKFPIVGRCCLSNAPLWWCEILCQIPHYSLRGVLGQYIDRWITVQYRINYSCCMEIPLLDGRECIMRAYNAIDT